jgi:hypothetical protein
LHAEGALATSPDGKHLKVERRMNGVKIRGWLLSSKVVVGYTKNYNIGTDVSTGATVSTEDERNKILENFQV